MASLTIYVIYGFWQTLKANFFLLIFYQFYLKGGGGLPPPPLKK
jgi:hypothetical protein